MLLSRFGIAQRWIDSGAAAVNDDPSTTFKTFGVVTIIGDIVALNGQPARGA